MNMYKTNGVWIAKKMKVFGANFIKVFDIISPLSLENYPLSKIPFNFKLVISSRIHIKSNNKLTNVVQNQYLFLWPKFRLIVLICCIYMY